MDGTEAGAAKRPQSQSRLSPVLFWVLAAAILFRIVTAVMDRPPKDGGRVSWVPGKNAATLARQGAKPILYDFTAAWCAPCKLLDKDWADPAIADRVNASFVPTRVVDRQREDGRNSPEVSELQRRYEISAFPTLVAVAPDGRVLGRMEGYRSRKALEAFLQESTGRE